jgi:hypothetical protein
VWVAGNAQGIHFLCSIVLATSGEQLSNTQVNMGAAPPVVKRVGGSRANLIARPVRA